MGTVWLGSTENIFNFLISLIRKLYDVVFCKPARCKREIYFEIMLHQTSSNFRATYSESYQLNPFHICEVSLGRRTLRLQCFVTEIEPGYNSLSARRKEPINYKKRGLPSVADNGILGTYSNHLILNLLNRVSNSGEQSNITHRALEVRSIPPF